VCGKNCVFNSGHDLRIEAQLEGWRPGLSGQPPASRVAGGIFLPPPAGSLRDECIFFAVRPGPKAESALSRLHRSIREPILNHQTPYRYFQLFSFIVWALRLGQVWPSG